MQVNNDFFESNKGLFTDSSVHTIDVNAFEPINLFFGTIGCRMYGINDVTIIPEPNEEIDITLSFEKVEPFTIKVSSETKIYQRPDVEYPCFKLNYGDNYISKKCFYEGTLLIKGNCKITQKGHIIYDG